MKSNITTHYFTRMRNQTLYIIAIIIASLLTASGQNDESKLDKFFTKKMKKADVVGMQVGYLKKDGTIWSGSYGKIKYKDNLNVNDSTLFMIASCSKPVTAFAILKLYNDKKIDLDIDINHYLPFHINNPNFQKKKIITVRMLLTHTSSFKDNWEVIDPLYTTEKGGDSPIPLNDFVSDYFTEEGKYYDSAANFFNKQPGSFWEYSNMGYAVLGLIIESASKKEFSKYMSEDIFTPLGMKNSFWFLRDITHNNIARPHVLPSKKSDSIKILPHYGYPDFPDGQLRTTTEDYLKLVRVILNEGKIGTNQFIDSDIIKQFQTVQFPEVHKHQAIAWNYDEFENWLFYLLFKRLPSHTGGDPGIASVASYNPKNGTAAVVFMNSPPVTFKGGKILYLDLPKKLLKTAER